MHVQVYESRSDNQPARVEGLIHPAPDFSCRGNFGHLIVAQQEVVHGVEFLCRVNNKKRFAVRFQIKCHSSRGGCYRPNAFARIAMRTGIPLATCSRMTDCGPSDTSLVNSIPKIAGPGCITSASRLARRNRSLFSW